MGHFASTNICDASLVLLDFGLEVLGCHSVPRHQEERKGCHPRPSVVSLP